MFFEDAVKTSTDKLKAFITISGFVLVIVGTVGLLLSELVWDGSSSRTVILAVVGLVGLVNLAFAHFGMRDVKAEGPGSV
ncbi:MAG: hypothetical protein SV910_03330 [Chloroflexota bacterium]|nr:hypothetical protein [Chloroflexota bacterium]